MKRSKKSHNHCEGSHILQSAEPGVYDHDSFLTFSPNDVCGKLGFERMKSRSQFLGLWHQFDDYHLFSLSKIHDLIFLIILSWHFMLNQRTGLLWAPYTYLNHWLEWDSLAVSVFVMVTCLQESTCTTKTRKTTTCNSVNTALSPSKQRLDKTWTCCEVM